MPFNAACHEFGADYITVCVGQMKQHIFCIFIDYRGQYRKGVAIYHTTSVNLQPKPWFH
jgi:hypothetical protein